jgi:hypothetical protein
MTQDVVSLLTGMAFTLAALLLGLREIFLRPDTEDMPNAPFWLTTIMFVYMVFLFFIGSNLTLTALSGRPIHVHPMFLGLAGVMAGYKGAMLVNMLRQWLPPAAWRRLNRYQRRAYDLARCAGPRSDALAVMAISSDTVIGPNEGPKALILEAEKTGPEHI